jgi:hypothetical protein
MLTGNILNSDALLNNYIITDSKKFIPGEDFSIVFQLYNPELGLRFIPDSASIISAVFNKLDGTTLTKVTTELDPADRSLRVISISDAESELIMGGNVQLLIDVLGDGSIIQKGFIQNGISKVLISGGC